MDDFDQAVQTLYPEVPLEAHSLARARARVLETVTPVVVAPRRQRWWPRLSAAAAAAAVVAVLAATALHRDGSPPPEAAMVEVAQTLNAAADAEIRTVDVAVPPGQFRYLATHALDLAISQGADQTVVARTGSRAEVWVPADRRAEWLRRETDTGERTWLVGTEADGRAAGLAFSPRPPTELRGRCGDWYPEPGRDSCARVGDWQVPTDAFVAGVPRDPRALFELLRKQTMGRGDKQTMGRGDDRDLEILVYVTDALRGGLLPADLRAALYRALALLPELTITERTATLDGRTGTALGITAAGRTEEIVIDPRTGDFLGERARLTEPMDGMRPGTVTRSTSITYGISPAAGAPPLR